jgi:hypothetical protein
MKLSPGAASGTVIVVVKPLSVPVGIAVASTGPVTLPSRISTGPAEDGLSECVAKYLPVTVTVVPGAAALGLNDRVAAAVQP